MSKDNLIDKIKRNIIKLIFAGQRTFKIGELRFTNGRPTTVKNSIIAENENYILKIQLYKHRLKHNDIVDEAKILNKLKAVGALCQPIIYSTGYDTFKRPYIIMEKIKNEEGIELADVLLAILEQHKLGVFHRDTKTDNICFNGLIAKLIDYDQSQIIDEIKDLKPKESIMFFINNLSHFWKAENMLLDINKGANEVIRRCTECFKGNAFDFSKTSLYKSFSGTPFYSVDEDEIKSKGKINIKDWQNALDKIEFKAGEKVIDINCDTGALSRYLHKRGCNVIAYSKNDNEIYSTKIISNILGTNIKTTQNIENEADTALILNTKENLNEIPRINTKRIIFRIDIDKEFQTSNFENYIKTVKIQADEKSKFIILNQKDI